MFGGARSECRRPMWHVRIVSALPGDADGLRGDDRRPRLTHLTTKAGLARFCGRSRPQNRAGIRK